MKICYCFDLEDSDIRAEIRAGAHSRRDVAMACGAGARCGWCLQLVSFLVADEQLRAKEAGQPWETVVEASTD